MIVSVVIIILVGLLAYLFYASYHIGSGVYLKALCRITTNEKIVFLTFDDGPDAVQTPKVLDVLKRNNLPATFFCIGNKLVGNKDVVQRMMNEEHQIGNHSFQHTAMFPLQSVGKIQKDLDCCQRALEEFQKEEVVLFRPPFGVTNPPIAKAVKSLGYTTVGWDIRTMDTQNISHSKILATIRKKIRPGSIILLHDRMPQSDLLLEKVLELLKEEGYKVKALREYIHNNTIN